MPRAFQIILGVALSLTFLALPPASQAFDAGVRETVLADPSPGAVSLPFEIPIRQSAAVPQPFEFELAVDGFSLDPEPAAGNRIGSLDMFTDAGDFDDKAIFSDGPGTDGVRTWTLNWQLGDPITATVEDGISLDENGVRTADPDSTLVSFTVPGNYHGFRLMGLSLRFNQQDHGEATPGLGAVNPAVPGRYLIRSRIRSVTPAAAVSLASTSVRVGAPLPDAKKTRIVVGVDRLRVSAGQRVRISTWTVNHTRDTAGIWLGGRLLRRFKVGPGARHFYWRARPHFRGRRVRFRIKPDHGPAKRLVIRVKK